MRHLTTVKFWSLQPVIESSGTTECFRSPSLPKQKRGVSHTIKVQVCKPFCYRMAFSVHPQVSDPQRELFRHLRCTGGGATLKYGQLVESHYSNPEFVFLWRSRYQSPVHHLSWALNKPVDRPPWEGTRWRRHANRQSLRKCLLPGWKSRHYFTLNRCKYRAC